MTDEQSARPTVVTLREAAAIFGIGEKYMQVLPSRHGPDSRRPFPEAVSRGELRQKLYPLKEIEEWIGSRRMGRPPTSRPPAYLSDSQWAALVFIGGRTIRQLPTGPRFWGTHPVGNDHVQLDQRVVGSLMVEGWVTAVGRRDRDLCYEPTPDGQELLDQNPQWVAKVQHP